MIATIKGCEIFVDPKCDRYVIVGGNFTNYVRVGEPGVTDYYFEIEATKSGFMVNVEGRTASGSGLCVKNNVPRVSHLRHQIAEDRIVIYDNNKVALAIEVDRERSLYIRVVGEVYDSVGEVVVRASADGIAIFKGPAVLGKSGDAYGIVVGGP